ncbi:MAG: hypothetical protein AB1486_12695 [Planctomycetota bacterium]
MSGKLVETVRAIWASVVGTILLALMGLLIGLFVAPPALAGGDPGKPFRGDFVVVNGSLTCPGGYDDDCDEPCCLREHIIPTYHRVIFGDKIIRRTGSVWEVFVSYACRDVPVGYNYVWTPFGEIRWRRWEEWCVPTGERRGAELPLYEVVGFREEP